MAISQNGVHILPQSPSIQTTLDGLPCKAREVEVALLSAPKWRLQQAETPLDVFYIEPATARILIPDDRIGPFDKDVWKGILRYLKTASLATVSQVSTRMRDLALPALYDTADFSLHSLAKYDPRLRTQQRLFAEQILQNPEYGLYVRSFLWTFALLPFTETTQDETKVYKMFEKLRNVEKLYIDVIPRYGISSMPTYELPPMFSKAVHVTLKGEIHEWLASAILRGKEKPPLQSLILENFEDGYWVANGISARTLPYVIHDLRCTNLQYLRMKKECFDFWHPEYDRIDQTTYGNWACFIQMAKPTHLSIEHGTHAEGQAMTSEAVQAWFQKLRALRGQLNEHSIATPPVSPPPPRSPLSVDLAGKNLPLKASELRFKNTLAPNLGRGWQSLERLTIRGVNPDAIILPYGVRCKIETLGGTLVSAGVSVRSPGGNLRSPLSAGLL